MRDVETDYSDSDLLSGIYERDDRIITSIISKMKPAVSRMVFAKGGTKDDISYIIEETIIIIYTKSERPVLISTFKTFFIGIAKKVWFNEFRRRLKRPKLSIIEDIELPQEESNLELTRQRKKLVLKHYHQLPLPCQEILMMMAFGYSNEEIMTKMQYSSVQYTKNRKLACYNKLIEILQKDPLFAELVITE